MARESEDQRRDKLGWGGSSDLPHGYVRFIRPSPFRDLPDLPDSVDLATHRARALDRYRHPAPGDERSMDERPHSISGLKAKYFQHILGGRRLHTYAEMES